MLAKTLLFMAMVRLAYSQDWGGLHIVNGDLAFGKKWNLQLHSRMRTNEDFRHFFQRRGGPIINYQLNSKVTLIGGYYFIGEEDSLRNERDFHRFFAGFATPIWRTKQWKVESRSLAERFVGTSNGDYMRLRQRLLGVWGQSTWRPYLQAEVLHVPGAWTGRFAGGIQYVPGKSWNAAFGYEHRQSPNGTYMHLITSSVQFQVRARRE